MAGGSAGPGAKFTENKKLREDTVSGADIVDEFLYNIDMGCTIIGAIDAVREKYELDTDDDVLDVIEDNEEVTSTLEGNARELYEEEQELEYSDLTTKLTLGESKKRTRESIETDDDGEDWDMEDPDTPVFQGKGEDYDENGLSPDDVKNGLSPDSDIDDYYDQEADDGEIESEDADSFDDILDREDDSDTVDGDDTDWEDKLYDDIEDDDKYGSELDYDENEYDASEDDLDDEYDDDEKFGDTVVTEDEIDGIIAKQGADEEFEDDEFDE
jgi:hypothetical protein